jgi:P27 family predicted phage terminase small subunit
MAKKQRISAGDPLRPDEPPPEHLSDGARLEWPGLCRTVAELGVVKRADVRALALLCEILASERELRGILAREGTLIPGANGNQKAHPALKALEAAQNRAVVLLAHFALTPKGRRQIRPSMDAASATTGTPWDVFFSK